MKTGKYVPITNEIVGESIAHLRKRILLKEKKSPQDNHCGKMFQLGERAKFKQ